jgi:hypothetical protein
VAGMSPRERHTVVREATWPAVPGGAQVRTRLECVAYEWRGVCGADATIDAGGRGGDAHLVPDARGGERLVGALAALLSGKT